MRAPGPGELAAYLTEQGVAYGSYVGVDGVSDVVEAAQQRGLPNARFVAGDFVADPTHLGQGQPDVIVMSGTLNTMDPPTAVDLLDAAWRRTGTALVFNFLSDQAGADAPPQVAPARRLPTLELLEWALMRTHDVVLRHDYFAHGHDATILLRKPKPSSSPPEPHDV